MTTFESLPTDVIFNILWRLPSESLFTFICVSKFWYALICDSTNSSLLPYKHILFMRLQKDSNSEQTQLILSDLTIHPSMSIFDDFHLPLPFDWNLSPWSGDMPFPFDDNMSFPFGDDIDFYEHFHIHGHSHGLICLTDYRRRIVLCNPTTKEFRNLPPSIIIHTDPSFYIYNNCGTNAVGFGYDPKSRDFKVVRLVCYCVDRIYWRGEVFELSKDRWREIQVPNIDIGVGVPTFGMYYEGTIFWTINIHGDQSETERMYSFDMNEEVFGQIRLPESVGGVSEYWSEFDLGVLNESIVIFHYSTQQSRVDQPTWDIWKSESTLNIWRMEKNEESSIVLWSKSFTISVNWKSIGRPLMFMNSNQILTIQKGQVNLYNIKTRHLKELPIKGHAHEDGNFLKCSRGSVACEATHFVKSLYYLKGEKY